VYSYIVKEKRVEESLQSENQRIRDSRNRRDPGDGGQGDREKEEKLRERRK